MLGLAQPSDNFMWTQATSTAYNPIPTGTLPTAPGGPQTEFAYYVAQNRTKDTMTTGVLIVLGGWLLAELLTRGGLA